MSRIDNAIQKAALARHNQTPAQELPPRPDRLPRGDESRENGGGQYSAFQSVPAPNLNNPFLVMANGENGPAAEQYRKLKSGLVKLAQEGKFDKSLMVTSSVGGEGKTLTSINLAVSLAQEFDHTVLLVEADIRRPSVLKYLGLEAEAGLTDCVLDGLDVGEVLVKTGIGKLSVLPAGRAVPNPVELFSSRRMQQILAEIKSRYSDRYLIVDTTPILPFAEPALIANEVGGVLFVVREGVSSLDKVKKGLGMLKSHNLLGVVCNGMSQKASLGGYYGYYGYYGIK
jgi:exopolysaccharide/PEP-CTERM locus tyrosine autokinase